MRLYGLIKAVMAGLMLLLAFLAFSSMRMMNDIRDYLIADSETRLHYLRDLHERDVSEAFQTTGANPFALQDLADRESLERISVYGADWTLLADSRRPGVSRVEPGDLHATPEQLKEALDGRTLVTQIYREDRRAFRTVYFLMRGRDGSLVGICGITIDVSYIEELTELGTTYFAVKAFLVVIVAVMLLYGVRSYVVSQRRMVQAVKNADVVVPGGQPGDDASFIISGFQTVVHDLREKEAELRRLKEAAEERARSIESFNEKVLRDISSGVVTFDNSGRVLTMNSAAEEIFGVTEADARGRISAELAADGWLGDAVDRTITGGSSTRRDEGPVRTVGAETKWIGASCSPLSDEEGGSPGAILVVADLTEVRSLRERMELNERMSLLGEMSAGIAHELRNPMAVISGYSKLLAAKLGDADEDTRHTVAEIQAEINGMDRLIAEFMKFAQPSDLEMSRQDVGAILDEAVGAIDALGDAVEVTVEYLDGPFVVEADALLVRQAFMNLIGNAADAMGGSGRLKVTCSAHEAADGSDRPGRFVRIDFDDEGPGVPEDIRRKVFAPFFTTKHDGTGLGLALVQKIITHHGGWCSVSDSPSGGARFTVYIPAAEG